MRCSRRARRRPSGTSGSSRSSPRTWPAASRAAAPPGLVPVAAVLGAVLVVAADALGRTLLAPVEIPVGIMTAVLGTPYLIWLMRRTPTA
ncbi:iron chelate uptake ABC transporter family permease subunit [Actinomadura sp. CNU-125]|uniref:iron chelate uptake ABC transporter family permease subunit n=1 Tax=Actinomadura sp. CNU-125 TaxID=1904961 RepID=UPI0039670BA3